jgi:hypothetical protein
MKQLAHVEKFAAGSKTPLFAAFYDYWKHYRYNSDPKKFGKYESELVKTDDKGNHISFAEKEDSINKMLKEEIMYRANVPYTKDTPVEQWFTHPVIQHETFAIVEMLVDMILPETIIDSIGAYTDVRIGGFGDSFSFKVTPRDLFPVTQVGRGQRTAELQKQFDGIKTIVPTMHEVSVMVSLYRVLAGQDSLASFVAKATQSLETQVTIDAYTAFAAALAAVDASGNTQLQATGYTQSVLVDFAQKVQSYNMGAKPLILGTQLALQNVLPLDANYRYSLTDEFVKLGYVPSAFGFDMLLLPQIAAWNTPYTKVLDDTKIWIVSPSSNKILKLCFEGQTLSNTTGTFDSSMLLQSTTLWKSWGLGVATNAIAALINL